jgi:hypothetical protein
MHHQVSLQLHLSPTQPLGLTTISSPCEPHHSSTSTLSLPLLRKHIQQVCHLWNTAATLVLDRWYWTALVWWSIRWVWSAHITVFVIWASIYSVVERCQVRWCKMCIHSISRFNVTSLLGPREFKALAFGSNMGLERSTN